MHRVFPARCAAGFLRDTTRMRTSRAPAVSAGSRRTVLIAVLLTAFLLPLAARARTQPATTLAGGRWFKGNTHTHTVNSDGDSTPDEVVRWYREHGYQFLVLTDHNYLTPTTGLNAVHGAPDKFIVIPGEEVTMTVAT
jgi:hypothetical protein